MGFFFKQHYMEKLPMQSDDLTSAIFLVRGQRVMLDEDLAMVYGVETRVLNQAVKRNSSRFPVDFMFKLLGRNLTV